MSERGFLFLRGELSVPRRIWCREGVVVDRSDENVSVNDVRGVVLDKPYWDSYWQKQRYHESDGPRQER